MRKRWGSKSWLSLGITIGLLASPVPTPVHAAAVSQVGATYFTDSDNWGGYGSETVDNDLDNSNPRIANGDPKYPIEFKMTGVTQVPKKSAHLLVRAYDVDEYDGSSNTGEWDRLYFSSKPEDLQLGDPITKWPADWNASTSYKKEFNPNNYVGALSGNNNTWNTTLLEIDPSIITADSTDYYAALSTHHYFKAGNFSASWVVEVDWGQLVIDGGPRQTATLIHSNNQIVGGKMIVDTGFIPKNSGNYSMEVSLIQMVKDADGNVVEQNLDTKSKLFAGAASETTWSNIQLGSSLDPNKEYTVNIILFDDRGRNIAGSIPDPGKAEQIYSVSSLKDIAKTGAQFEPTALAADDFKDKFAKIDKSAKPAALQEVKIVTLPDPSRGTLVLDGGTDPTTPVSVNQVIPIANMDNLKFVPAEGTNGFTGSASFTWNGSDDGVNYAIFDGTVTLTADAAPTVDNIVKPINKGDDVTFTSNDFIVNKYTDPESKPLDHIKVTGLPDSSEGTLYLGTTAVTDGLEIAAADLGQLKFEPQNGKTGTVTFNWNGSDGVQYALVDKKVTIQINTPPVVHDLTKTGLSGAVISFTAAEFESHSTYEDADGDMLQKATLTLPNSFANDGTLWYTSVSGVTYFNPGTSKTVSKTELDTLKFKPAANLDNGGTVTFSWKGNDGKQDAEASALVNIKYNGVPVAQPLVLTVDEEVPSVAITLKGSDMETVTGLVYGIKSQPAKGTLTLAIDHNPDGDRYVYTPSPGFTGEDSFTYTVSDSDGQKSAAVTVTVKINKLLDGWSGNKNQGDITPAKVLPGQTLKLSAVSSLIPDEVNALVSGITVPLTLTNSETYVTDGFKKWEISTYKLPAGTQPGIYPVTFTAYEEGHIRLADEPSSRLADNSFEVPEPAVLQLTANPANIIGDGKSTTVLTAVLTNKDGTPIQGTEVVFSAPDGIGSFVGPNRTITDSQGKASVTYQSSKITGVKEQVIPLLAKVLDIEKGLSAQEQLKVTFLPPTISGVITNGTSHLPVKGATVRVTLDLNGDGHIEPGVDFDQSVVTQADGSYSLPVPEGDKEYNLEFTQNVMVGGIETPVKYNQKANVGAVTGSDNESFDSEKTVTGLVLLQKQDGTSGMMDPDFVSGMKVYMKDADGNYLMENGTPKAFPLQNQGVFNVNGLTKDVKYSMEIRYEVAPGQEIVLKRSTVQVTSNGEMNIAEELIDPYGTITDAETKQPIAGANVVLYYADTQRNKDNGKVPNTAVVLPVRTGFPPNDNKSPDQLTDGKGFYAYMVYPNTDYYIAVSKEGYVSKTSDTISVGMELVQQDLELTPIHRSSRHTSSGSSAVVEAPNVSLNLSVDKNLVQEGGTSTITLDYKNLSTASLAEGTISVTLPDGAELVNASGATVDGKTLTWKVTNLAAGQTGSLSIGVKWNQITAADTEYSFPAQFSVNANAADTVNATSAVKVKIFSDRFGQLKHQRYILGYPDGKFKPDRTLSRAELAAIVARLTENVDLADPIGYTDVPASHWAANYIKIATKHGYFNGFEGGTFRPESPVTRGELASVMARFLKLDVSQSGTVHFNDVDGHWATDAIEELYRSHYLSGYPDGSFKPQNNIIRSEAVTLINRMLYRGPLQGAAGQFPDVNEQHWAFGDVQEATVSHEAVRSSDTKETWKNNLTDDVK